jgi:hypothetical protein
MNQPPVWYEAKARNFQKTPNGVQWEAVIFSSEFNRNASYFDIHKLARWSKKLNKVAMNNNHDGKYFSAITDKVVSIEVQTDENGITECFAVVESTNPEKIANPEMVTGFSIELMVDKKDVISNENGEYYIDFEWVGIAYLISELAGSGDTRLLSMKTFSSQNNPTQPQLMNEEQVKAILAEQKTELTTEFSALLENTIETIKAEFSEKQLLHKGQTKTNGTMSWVNEDGDTITEDWESIYTSIVTKTKNESPTALEVMEYIAQNFGVETEKKETEKSEAETTPPAGESEPELTKIENSILNAAEKMKVNMSKNITEGKVDQNGAVIPAVKSVTDFKKSISNTIKSINNL